MEPWHKHTALIAIILWFDFLVVALPRSLMPELFDQAYGKDAYRLLGLCETVRGLLIFVTAPSLGALSDVAGRKWLFIACIFGTAAPSVTLALTPTIDLKPRLNIYFVVLAFSGLLASTFALAFAHLSDYVPTASRSHAYGIAIGVGLGGAFMVGPGVGAWIARAYDTQTAFNLCLVLTIISAAITIVGIRDKPRRSGGGKGAAGADGGGVASLSRREMWRRANPLASVGLVRSNPALYLLSGIVFLYYLALWGFIASSLLYARRRFQLESSASAALLTCFGAASLLSQSIGLRYAQRVLSEPQITRRCLGCASAALAIYGFATQVWVLYPCYLLLGISVGGFACISSMASQVVPATQVGEAQGVITSLKALTEGLGPAATAAALPWFEDTALPGAPWVFSALIIAGATALCLKLEPVLQASPHLRAKSKNGTHEMVALASAASDAPSDGPTCESPMPSESEPESSQDLDARQGRA